MLSGVSVCTLSYTLSALPLHVAVAILGVLRTSQWLFFSPPCPSYYVLSCKPLNPPPKTKKKMHRAAFQQLRPGHRFSVSISAVRDTGLGTSPHFTRFGSCLFQHRNPLIPQLLPLAFATVATSYLELCQTPRKHDTTMECGCEPYLFIPVLRMFLCMGRRNFFPGILSRRELVISLSACFGDEGGFYRTTAARNVMQPSGICMCISCRPFSGWKLPPLGPL